MKCPTVRATRGSFSGPMTISATAPISAILSNPKSIMRREATRSGSRLRFDVDGVRIGGGLVRADLGRRCRRIGSGRTAVAHAVLEALDGATEVGADVLQLLRAEHENHDQQHDQPMPDAE